MLENIRNFLNKSVETANMDFDYFMSDITSVSKVFGIDFLSADWKIRKALRLVVPFFLNFLYAFVFESYYLIYYQDDPGVIVKSIFVSMGTITFFVKLIITFWYRETIIELFGEIKNDFWSFHEENWLKKKILIAGSIKSKFIFRSYLGFYTLGFVVYVIRPILTAIFLAKFDAPMMFPMPGDSIMSIFV